MASGRPGCGPLWVVGYEKSLNHFTQKKKKKLFKNTWLAMTFIEK